MSKLLTIIRHTAQQPQNTVGKLWQFLFYGNVFYGFIATMLALESSLQLHITIAPCIYLLIFTTTIVYYNQPFTKFNLPTSQRSQWFYENRKLINVFRKVYFIAIIMAGVLYTTVHWNTLLQISCLQIFLLITFPAIALLYYGCKKPGLSLRKYGILKPLFIGFVWSGVVTVLPKLLYTIHAGIHFQIGSMDVFYFTINLIFISLLALMFDIKDFEDDKIQSLKTIVVGLGIHKTISHILIPLSILTVAVLASRAVLHHFGILHSTLLLLPFMLLPFAAESLKQPKPLLYYLVVIDGIMLLKAVTGIAATFV